MLRLSNLLRGTETCNIFSKLKQTYIRHRKIDLIKTLYQATLTLPIIALEKINLVKEILDATDFTSMLWQCISITHADYRLCSVGDKTSKG